MEVDEGDPTDDNPGLKSRSIISYNDLFIDKPAGFIESKTKRKQRERDETIYKYNDSAKRMNVDGAQANSSQSQRNLEGLQSVSNQRQQIFINKNQATENKFESTNQGPYSVWVKEIVPGKNRIEAYTVANILFKKKYTQILNVATKNGKNVEIFCKTIDEANRLISDTSLMQHNLQVFIPTYRKIRRGIVRNVPENLDLEEIAKGLEAEVEVESVTRLMRKNREPESEEKWIPSRTLLISFIGQVIPTSVCIFKVRSYVDPYVASPLQCYRCFRFGHSAKTCRSQEICIQCAEEKHEESQCSSELKCRNCQKNHRSTSHACEVYQDYYKINVTMAYDNLPFSDAFKQVCGDKYKKAPLKTRENFPQIREQRKRILLNKFNENKNNTSYSQALQNKPEANTQEDQNKHSTTQDQRQQEKINTNKTVAQLNSRTNSNLSKTNLSKNIVDKVASKLVNSTYKTNNTKNKAKN